MGQALRSAAQWTSAKDGAVGKLEITELNQSLLSTILEFIEGFSAKNPDEANLVFKSPLTWDTNLNPSQLAAAAGFKEEWVFSYTIK